MPRIPGRAGHNQEAASLWKGRKPPPKAGLTLWRMGTHLSPPALLGITGGPPGAVRHYPRDAVTQSPPRQSLTSRLSDQQSGAMGQSLEGVSLCLCLEAHGPTWCVHLASSYAPPLRIFWRRSPLL